MQGFLAWCSGGTERQVAANSVAIAEGSTTGHLYVLIEGRLEVIKGDAVVAVVSDPGALLGEMSVLLDKPHTATVRAATDSRIYEITDARAFLDSHPEAALRIAQTLAQRLNAANTYLADLKTQYAGHGTHLAMVGEVLQSMINLPPRQVEPGSDRESDPRL